MSSGRRDEAKTMAVQKYREATLWRVAFDRAVEQWRTWAIYYVTQQYLVRRAEQRRSPHPIISKMREESDRAHDAMLSIKDNMDCLSRTVLACEMGGRIYDEEAEEREWARSVKEESEHGYHRD